tara:strand:+ start:540 stop:650 length:111 start_codon:yes stop_codon:yes gene_type:complete
MTLEDGLLLFILGSLTSIVVLYIIITALGNEKGDDK